MKDLDNQDITSTEKESETPNIVLCDLGELDWVKVEGDLILVNKNYI